MTPVNILAIYRLIRETAGIKHIDIYNQQYIKPAEKISWAMPAVFIEFAPIMWDGENQGMKTSSAARIRLHCVIAKISDTANLDLVAQEEIQNKALDAFNFSGQVHLAIQGKQAGNYGLFDKVGNIDDHNHKGFIVEILEYKARLTDDTAYNKRNWIEKNLTDMNITGNFKNFELEEEEEFLPQGE